jgi:hypothetical protein
MATYDVDSNIRIVIPVEGVTDIVRNYLIGANASPTKDPATWMIDVDSESGEAGFEQALRSCLELIQKLKTNSWWSTDWSTTTWVTVSSRGEFAGLAVPKDISRRAGELGVDFVFSVYCCQDD